MISNNPENPHRAAPAQRELACRYLGLEPLIARALLSMDTLDPDPIEALDVEVLASATSEVAFQERSKPS